MTETERYLAIADRAEVRPAGEGYSALYKGVTGLGRTPEEAIRDILAILNRHTPRQREPWEDAPPRMTDADRKAPRTR